MTRKVQLVPPAPVVLSSEMADFRETCWSGREDSNLRPLPPERIAPARTRRFSALSYGDDLPSGGACSRLIHGRRFAVNFRPLSIWRLYG
jgi:hypothetical protein